MLLSKIKSGVRLYDRFSGRTQVVAKVDKHASFLFLHFKDERTGNTTRQPFSISDLDRRFELVEPQDVAFRARARRLWRGY